MASGSDLSPLQSTSGGNLYEANLKIQERKAAEQASALLSAIVDSSDDAIISKNLSGVITSWNKSAERLFGYTADEAIGKSVTMLIPADRLDEEPKILEQLKRGERVDHFETIRMRKDGSLLDISLTISPVKDANGRIIGASKIARDITEQKRAREVLQNLNAELESRVAERTADLRRSLAERERLQDQLLQAQKMESIGTLATGVAHDFNNILNIILSHAIVMRLGEKNSASITEGAAVIEETVRRGASLVQQLLTLGRKNETSFEPVRLNSVAEKLANLLRETFTKTISIILDLDPGLPTINGDENQLHQTLLNLCVNARDAMPDGGRISLKTETVSGGDLRCHVPEAAAERYVAISVSDSGSGMDAATQRRVFEPFFTTKPLEQGTGLGLAVVYGIVKTHDGFIDVKSKLGDGTTFCIHLPIPTEAARQRSEAASNSTGLKRAGSGETILFVDDEETQLNVMRHLLESEGYRVLGAKTGVEALETFKQNKDAIAVAVLDLGLPQLGGWQAFQQMREIRHDLKVLITTGFVTPEVEAEMANGKLSGVIVKPYRLDDVLEKISQAIHHTAETGSHRTADITAR
jgi:two-component system, cell cycle sensor histidine kinase and response regulator CckA